MNLLITFFLQFSILVNGAWEPRVQTGVVEQAIIGCHDGLVYYRHAIGADPQVRFEAFGCVESWRNADGSRYVRPE